MTISAKIIADSISSETGIRLTSIEARYPRFIHAEVMTHRVFSRNASSSRAIPVKKLIQDVMDDPAMPIHWGKNQPGMQAKEEHDSLIFLPFDKEEDEYSKTECWIHARDNAIEVARAFDKAGYHKQIVNRILEPFCHITVIITSTEWDNFFALRRHIDAQPEIRALADAIYYAMMNPTPQILDCNGWHLPYITKEDWEAGQQYLGNPEEPIPSNIPFVDDTLTELMIRASVARCARTSYKLHDGSPSTFEKDIQLYDRLVGSEPLHASPTEHQATPDVVIHMPPMMEWQHCHYHGNLNGWVQYRKLLEDSIKG